VGAVQPVKRAELISKLQASMVIAEAKSSKGIAFLYSPQAPIYAHNYDVFKKTIEDAGGSVEPLALSQVDIGTKVPEQVVSFLQRNPDTKYLVATDDSWLTGVPDAIAAAGIEGVKIIGQGTGQKPTQVENGQEYAMVSGDLATDGWNAVDMMARLSVGEKLEDSEPIGVIWAVNKKNVGQFPQVFPGIPGAYTKAWGV
jgi:ribose transport system substrate-binding protein